MRACLRLLPAGLVALWPVSGCSLGEPVACSGIDCPPVCQRAVATITIPAP